MQRFKDFLFLAVPDDASGTAFEHTSTVANNNQANLTVVEVMEKKKDRLT